MQQVCPALYALLVVFLVKFSMELVGARAHGERHHTFRERRSHITLRMSKGRHSWRMVVFRTPKNGRDDTSRDTIPPATYIATDAD